MPSGGSINPGYPGNGGSDSNPSNPPNNGSDGTGSKIHTLPQVKQAGKCGWLWTEWDYDIDPPNPIGGRVIQYLSIDFEVFDCKTDEKIINSHELFYEDMEGVNPNAPKANDRDKNQVSKTYKNTYGHFYLKGK